MLSFLWFVLSMQEKVIALIRYVLRNLGVEGHNTYNLLCNGSKAPKGNRYSHTHSSMQLYSQILGRLREKDHKGLGIRKPARTTQQDPHQHICVHIHIHIYRKYICTYTYGVHRFDRCYDISCLLYWFQLFWRSEICQNEKLVEKSKTRSNPKSRHDRGAELHTHRHTLE